MPVTHYKHRGKTIPFSKGAYEATYRLEMKLWYNFPSSNLVFDLVSSQASSFLPPPKCFSDDNDSMHHRSNLFVSPDWWLQKYNWSTIANNTNKQNCSYS